MSADAIFVIKSDLNNSIIEVEIHMSKVCAVTGKRPMVGNNVSHAKNRTKRRFEPNIRSKRFYSEAKGTWVRLKVSSNGMRIIDKKGIDAVLAEIESRDK